MRIGFIRGGTVKEEMVRRCDKIVFSKSQEKTKETIMTFIEEYGENELVFQSMIELRLQVIQWLPILEKISEDYIKVSFIDKGAIPISSDKDYIQALLALSRQERDIRSACTKATLESVDEHTFSVGRPTINESIITKIGFLYHQKGKSIREVAAICEVSVGSVHKYLKQAASEKIVSTA